MGLSAGGSDAAAAAFVTAVLVRLLLLVLDASPASSDSGALARVDRRGISLI